MERIRVEKYIIFGFDMEQDIGGYLHTYDGVINGTGKILSILKKYDVEATFLFTGDTALQHPDKVVEISKLGHEAGCHSLKHETVGDVVYNMPNHCPILESELEARLVENVRIVREITNKKPVTFRAPRLWQGQTQIGILEKLGFKVDASYSVATNKKQIIPYHPSKDNWLEKGSMNILEIPNFAFLDNDTIYDTYYTKNAQWPLLRILGAEFVYERQKYVIKKQREHSNITVLLFYLHPWEFEAMPEKVEYGQGLFIFKPELVKNCGDAMVAAFDKYINLSIRDGYKIVSCEKLYDIWTRK